MREIFLFMMVSVDGYFEGVDHDLSWHQVDEEFNKFAIDQLHEVDTIFFGRVTYEMMASFWPSEQALKVDPMTAKLMNNTPKIVFSRTLKKVEETENWKNIRLIKDNVAEEVRKLKEQPGKNIAIFGSNNLMVNLVEMGLVDEFRIMVNPVVLGNGNLLFKGIKEKLKLKLVTTKQFGNGNILLYYQK